MYDVIGTFDCGNITINGQEQQRVMSAMMWQNAPHVIRKAAFQPGKVR